MTIETPNHPPNLDKDQASSAPIVKDGYTIPSMDVTDEAATFSSSAIVSACNDEDMQPNDGEYEVAHGKKRRKRCLDSASSSKDEANLQVGHTVMFIPTRNHQAQSLCKFKLTDVLNNGAPDMILEDQQAGGHTGVQKTKRKVPPPREKAGKKAVGPPLLQTSHASRRKKSLADESSSTAAAAFETVGVGLSARRAHHATNTTTDLAAILLALEAFEKGSTRGGKWVISCDSQATLSLLDNLERAPPLARRIAAEAMALEQLGHQFRFQWLPSHCGIMENEIADQMANFAHDEPSTPTSKVPPSAEAKLLVAREIASQHPDACMHEQGNRGCLPPTLDEQCPHPRMNKQDESL
ncbi:hypothetical protein HPB47_016463 [Ixodes persulcatus]|uniref:Uncharacterized protein n=1 Tax=Ixodes persulcatus TaxID=34615 RepID=A0AC60QR01_IXOPE|nr:hypothetical protein HPB47_016463 [Ixodes persulcatus]